MPTVSFTTMTFTTKSLRLSLAIACALPLSAAAQSRGASSGAVGTAGQCKWSPKDAWVKRQAEFFDESKHDWSNDSLRTALLSAAGLTAPLTAPVNMGVEIVGRERQLGATADAMTAKLKALAAERGSTWPTRSVVGPAGTHAVYLLAQRDTGLARTALHRMMEAGPAESPAIDVAVFEDHMRLVWGRKQLYGTQFRMESGKVTLAPMEDSAHADLRREDAGLPPFKVGVCMANAGAK
jgi:hypothetical protein